MVDEEAARTLEQEAIALVNLSNGTPFVTTGKPKEEAQALRNPSDVALELYVRASSTETTSDSTSKMTPNASEPVTAETETNLLDGNISMKSLLVTLKKRKLQHDEVEADDDSNKLPSFRDVFQPQPQPQTEAATGEEATSAQLKCKYRTGKCHNARALKSCGDYHNLCNYHRLRANANQRKLDRKKKEQRLQQQRTANECEGSQSGKHSMASSHAAAAALASLVAAQPQHQFDMLQQTQLYASGVAMQDAAMGKNRRNRSTGVRPKQEDACSY